MCIAEFAAYYYKNYKIDRPETADAQPEILNDDTIEPSNTDSFFPQKIKLLNSTETMKCRNVKAVIRYHTPNKTKEPERYFHHLLMLYYPWRFESELLGSDQTYISKFYEPKVQTVVEQNKNVFEPDSDAVIEALDTLRNNKMTAVGSFDPINDQENEDLQTIVR